MSHTYLVSSLYNLPLGLQTYAVPHVIYTWKNGFNKRFAVNMYMYMAHHAGPRRYECNPGTKLWRPPVTVLSPEERF